MHQLPEMLIGGKTYKPTFQFGTEADLRKYLSVARKSGERYYPLIWLKTPMEEAEIVTLDILIATPNKRTDMGNWDRLAITFGTTLDPLFDNIIKAIKRSGPFRLTSDYDRFYRGTKYFNYHLEPEIWDAIDFQIEVRYNSDCLVKEIIF